MPLFNYKALSNQNKTIKGQISANNKSNLISKLRQVKLELLSAREIKPSKYLKKISQQDLILMCMHLEQMEQAGIPILDTMTDFKDLCMHKKLKNALTYIHNNIKSRKTLSESLELYPDIFNKVFSNLIRIGEKSGNLAEILGNLTKYLKWEDKLKHRIRKGILHSIAKCFFIILAITIILRAYGILLIPKHIQPPNHITLLINCANFIHNHIYQIISICIIFYTISKLLSRYSKIYLYCIHTLKLLFPGNLTRKIEIAKFCYVFMTASANDIEDTQSLSIAINSVENTAFKQKLQKALKCFMDGMQITDALNTTQQFSRTALQILQIGEKSGNLAHSLANIYEIYNDDINSIIEYIMHTIRPIFTLCLSIILFWVIYNYLHILIT